MRGPDEDVVMQRRIVGAHAYMDVVADVDGPVHAAILSTGPCFLGDASLTPSGYLFHVKPRDRDSGLGGGVLTGDLENFLPRVVLPFRLTGSHPSYVAGASVFLEHSGGAGALRSLSTGEELRSVGMPEAGLNASNYSFLGDTLFFGASSPRRSVIAAVPPNENTRTLIGRSSAEVEALAAFSTDGTDMVWVQARRKASSPDEMTSAALWTAKYSLDAATVERSKRRIRPVQLGLDWSTPRVVGCGLDAGMARGQLEPSEVGFSITGLRDGKTWTVLSSPGDQNFVYRSPRAITCNEVFVEAFRSTGSVMTRIRLDSLTADPAPPSP